MTAEFLRQLLLFYLTAQFGLTIVYLCQRRLSTLQVLFWGLFALLIPALGPFIVIAARPRRRAV